MKSAAVIEIHRRDGQLVSAKGFMPTWHVEKEDGSILVKIPFLKLETYAYSEEDIEAAVNEAFQLFCQVSEKIGPGVEQELLSMGWEFEEQNHIPVFIAGTDNETFASILDTADNIQLHIEARHSVLEAA